MHSWIKKLDPAVPKLWLIVLAGGIWSITGLMLCNLAYGWLLNSYFPSKLYLLMFSVLMAFFMYRFLFLKIVTKNINRLSMVAEKSCLFAFQAWNSYLIIIVMIFFGYLLRHSQFPKHYLAFFYLMIGGALFLASLQYYKFLWKTRIQN